MPTHHLLGDLVLAKSIAVGKTSRQTFLPLVLACSAQILWAHCHHYKTESSISGPWHRIGTRLSPNIAIITKPNAQYIHKLGSPFPVHHIVMVPGILPIFHYSCKIKIWKWPSNNTTSVLLWEEISRALSDVSYQRGSVAVESHQQWNESCSPAAMLHMLLHQYYHQSAPHIGCNRLWKCGRVHMVSLSVLSTTTDNRAVNWNWNDKHFYNQTPTKHCDAMTNPPTLPTEKIIGLLLQGVLHWKWCYLHPSHISFRGLLTAVTYKTTDL